MRLLRLTLLVLAMALAINPVAKAFSLDTLDNYRGWGWEVLLVQNDYITLAIVPSIGGRILQYDMEQDTFMIVNEDLFGQTFYDGSLTPWDGTWGYGGYKTWPAPQSEWNWTPPPVMAWGDYEYETTHVSGDSIVIWMKGQTEVDKTPGLRFDRYITVYNKSTRVKLSTVLFNDNSSAESWSIWDVTQVVVQHESQSDYTNFSAYIPIQGSSDVWDDGGGPSYEEVMPGIYKIQFTGVDGKMFSMSSEGWSCMVDERDEQCYAKIFDFVEGADYPDGGANVEYYTNGGSNYMEMEVLGPIEEIGPNGQDSIIFVEDWYVASTGAAMHTANHAGVVLSPLTYSRSSKTLSGKYAVFHEGTLYAAYVQDNGSQLGWANIGDVSPLGETNLNAVIDPPTGIDIIKLKLEDNNGNFIAFLDEIEVADDDSFVAYKVPETPTIDGLADEAFWDTTSWYALDYIWIPYDDQVDPEDFTGRFKLAWDEDYLYMLVEAIDDSLHDGHTDPLQNYWDDDCVEVFLDEDHSGGNHLTSYNAFAYHVGIEYDVVDNNASGSAALFNDHIDAVRTADGDTYTWELAIKVYDDSYDYGGTNTPVSLEHAKEMGFSLAYCDTDGSSSRENFIGSKYLSEAESNNSYIDASIFGSLTLIDPAGGGTGPDMNLSQMEENMVHLYPNPAQDMLIIRFEESLTMDCQYQLRSMTGQLVATGTLTVGEATARLNLSGITGGIYVLELKSDQVNMSKSVIVR